MAKAMKGGIVMIFGIMLVVIIVGVVLWGISANNNIVRANTRMEEAKSNIDVMLERRADLVPNLVNTVKGYAKHESETLSKITELRNQVKQAPNLQAKSDADAQLGQAMPLFVNALREAYPDLKANTNFSALQEELTNTENKVANARQFFNNAVRAFNNTIQVFPNSIIANMKHWTKADSIVIEDAKREAPKVEF